MRTERHTKSFAKAMLLGTAIVMGAALYSPTASFAAEPNWTPQSSERLVKLPANYLKKSLDHDFSQSELGTALAKADEDITFKAKTLADLQNASAQATGEVRDELRLQFLAEKRDYIQQMSQRNDLRRKHLMTKKRVFENLVDRANYEEGTTPAQQKLLDNQDAAIARFESTLDKVDMKLFADGAAVDSKYSQKHSANMSAIEKLMARITNHKMNEDVTDDGVPLTREEQLRRMAADTEAELAILDQEETILGYMAKLVALDAMALSEESMDAELADSDIPGATGPASAVSFFLSN